LQDARARSHKELIDVGSVCRTVGGDRSKQSLKLSRLRFLRLRVQSVVEPASLLRLGQATTALQGARTRSHEELIVVDSVRRTGGGDPSQQILMHSEPSLPRAFAFNQFAEPV
jgi:hypothetical protein